MAFTLAKRIPVAAGLGGGSADAAAALLALNDVWECGLALDRLLELAAEVGSDVPAQLHGGPVLARGRGEVLGPVVVAPAWWVILPLGFPVRTPDAFAWWDEEGSTGLDPSAILEAAREGDLERLGALLFNDLEGPVARRHPEIVEAKLRLLDAGALGAVMSGSGPTVAGLARDEFHARRIANASHGAIVVSGPG